MGEKKCIDFGKECNAKRCNRCRRNASTKTPSFIKSILRRNKKWISISTQIQLMYNGRCAFCKWRVSEYKPYPTRGCKSISYGNEIHHIIPISKNGTDEISNLILLCPNHHKQADYGIITLDEIADKQIKEEDIDSSIQMGINQLESIKMRELKDIHLLL